MTTDKLYEKALRSINDLFSARSVSEETARENVQVLKDAIDILLDAPRETARPARVQPQGQNAVDISGEMVRQARIALRDCRNAHIFHNNGCDLTWTCPQF